MSNLLNPYRFGGAASSLLTGLVSWWSLDETSGTRVDSHGSHDLTDNNTVLFTTGKQGNAAAFVAANDEYLSLASHSDFVIGNRDFTVAGWASFTSSSNGAGVIIGKTSNPVSTISNEWSVARQSIGTSIQFACRDFAEANTVAAIATGPGYGTFFHFIAQYDDSASQISLEINRGTPVTASITGIKAATEPLHIGGVSTTRDLDGAVDECAFWSRLLTTDEKDELYNSGSGMVYPG